MVASASPTLSRGLGPDADAAGDLCDLFGRRAVSCWIGTAMTRQMSTAKFMRKPSQSLLASMPTMSMSGRSPDCGRIRATPRYRPAPVSPARRGRAVACALDGSEACSKGACGNLQRRDAAQGGDCGTRVVELMAAKQMRRRQVDEPGFVPIDHAAVLGRHDPVLATNTKRRAQGRSLPFDHRERLQRLGRGFRQHIGLEDTRLLRRDQFMVLPRSSSWSREIGVSQMNPKLGSDPIETHNCAHCPSNELMPLCTVTMLQRNRHERLPEIPLHTT